MKKTSIGGQAVMEGVMMKNLDRYAVAVRKPDHEIEVMTDEYKSLGSRYAVLGLPIIRGVVNFGESLYIGLKTLSYSSSFYEEEDYEPGKVEQFFTKIFGDKLESVLMGITMVISVILALGIFMVLPFFLTNLMKGFLPSYSIRTLIEGIIRVALFLIYIWLISKMEDIKRVFMYHGAEHKCINCIEHGMELNVENVRRSSKEHKRCGTSFLMFVVILSVVLFLFIRVDSHVLRLVLRLALVPVIAGVSYELLRVAGRSDNPVINLISKPGLWMQGLTTKEPDDEMIEVGIASVEAVFDWRAYIAEIRAEEGISEEINAAVSPEGTGQKVQEMKQ